MQLTKMEELFSLQNSSLTLVTQNHLMCAAFPGAIVFGKMKNKYFSPHESFIFRRSEYHLIFLTFVQIAKVFSASKSSTKSKMIQDEAKSYNWEVIKNNETPIVVFTIEKQSQEIFQVRFNPNELNHFCLTIKELILPSLCLKFSESELLRNASLSSVTQIKRFKTKEECHQYVKNYFKKDEHLYEAGAILLYYYRDILMVLHKLEQFYSEKDDEDVLKLICRDIN